MKYYLNQSPIMYDIDSTMEIAVTITGNAIRAGSL